MFDSPMRESNLFATNRPVLIHRVAWRYAPGKWSQSHQPSLATEPKPWTVFMCIKLTGNLLMKESIAF